MSDIFSRTKFISNTLIIGERNTGKTTFLKEAIHTAVSSGYCVLLFDSATDHVEKSIFMYCISNFSNYVEIKSPEKEMIVDKEHYTTDFPFHIVNGEKTCNLFLFDVSKYLEEGYLYDDLGKRESIRLLYKVFVNQCLSIMLNFIEEKKCIVIMDEIEFIPQSYEIIKRFNSKNIYFINCLHSIDNCCQSILSLFNLTQFKTVY